MKLPEKEDYIFDTEANGLNPDKLWVISVRPVKRPNEERHWTKDNFQEFVDFYHTYVRFLICHNMMGYDKRKVLEPLLNLKIPTNKIIDTYCMSRMVDCDRGKTLAISLKSKGRKVPKEVVKNPHSLKTYGLQFGIAKPEQEQWEVWDPNMIHRCSEDTRINFKTFEYLMKDWRSMGFTWDSLFREQRVSEIVAQQIDNGHKLDLPFAKKLLRKLLRLEELLVVALENAFPLIPKPLNKDGVTFRTTKDGKVSKRMGSYKYMEEWADSMEGFKSIEDVVGGDFTPIEWIKFNPRSTDHRLAKLDEAGWEPVNFKPPSKTQKQKGWTVGNPLQTDEENLATIPDTAPKAIHHIGKYLMVKHRREIVEEWVRLAEESPDGRVRGYANSIGTPTARFRHNSPNMANVPAVKYSKNGTILKGIRGGFGWECRNCWTVEEGYTLLGVDADGLELRMLCHFMNDPDYTKAVVSGNKEDGTDIHSVNQKLAKLPTRDLAKTFIYACVTMDTQVLTKTGWKTYSDIEKGDLVLTYNQKENIQEWKPVLEKVFYKDAEVIEMSHSHSFKIKTTPNHRWFVRQRRQKGHKGDRYWKEEVRTTQEINKESNIIINAPYTFDVESTFQFKNEKYGVDWVREVLKMSSLERRAFLQGFLLADGYKSPSSRKSWIWNQNVNEISEGLLVASYLESDGHIYVTEKKGSKNPMIVVNISSKQHITGQKLKKKKLPNQPVWCIRTENESFVIRQGNCITITGNTLYGAGNEKIGRIINGSVQDGKVLRERFVNNLPALGQLIKKIQQEARKGYIRGLDGRAIRIRSYHAALNSLLQSAGAIVMKEALIVCDLLLKKNKIDYKFVNNVHDEFQIEVKTEDIPKAEKICAEAIRIAGERLNCNLPLKGSAQSGPSWAYTH